MNTEIIPQTKNLVYPVSFRQYSHIFVQTQKQAIKSSWPFFGIGLLLSLIIIPILRLEIVTEVEIWRIYTIGVICLLIGAAIMFFSTHRFAKTVKWPMRQDKRTRLDKVREKYWEGKTEFEMAKDLGLSESTIRRCKRTLRELGEIPN